MKSRKRKWSCSALSIQAESVQNPSVRIGGRGDNNESAKMSARLVEHAVVRLRYIVCLGRESREATVYYGAPCTI